MKFYLVSLKNTSKGDTALSFWSQNKFGLTWDRPKAGLFTGPEDVAEILEERDPTAKLLPQQTVDHYWMTFPFPGEDFVSVPNNPHIRSVFELDIELMKREDFASFKILPVTKKPD